MTGGADAKALAVAVVPAAGKGVRLGADKALLDLGGTPAIVRIVEQCAAAGIDEVLVVRRRDAAPLPFGPAPTSGIAVRTVLVSGDGEMADSLRAANAALPAAARKVVVFPVDHALVLAETVAAVAAALDRPGCAIALPLHRGRPGHPAAFARAAFGEIEAQSAVLRDVVRKDPSRVRVVPSANPWVLADLDVEEDLRAARCALAGGTLPVTEQMFRHRSRRAYTPQPLAEGQLERLVDAARHASTSSFIQAYAVVAVSDPAVKAKAAALCADQRHIHEAPLFLAICADLHKLAAACANAGTRVLHESFELFLQAVVDAALLGQNLQLAAESEGLGACMLGAARNHPVELAELLQLPPHAFVLFGMTLGHPADDPVARTRMPLEGVLHREAYDESRTAAVLEGADAAMRAWAARTNAERGGYQGRKVDERKGWVDRMAVSWGEQSAYGKARATLRAELERLGFGLR